MTEQADFAIPEVTLGWRIQMALDKGGLKQTDLMEMFEVSRGTVSRWCRDIGPAPKKFIINEIAVMCGVPATWLIYGDAPTGPGGGGAPVAPIPGDESPLSGSNRRALAYLVPRRLALVPVPDIDDEAAA